ncbi:aryl-sulfate sulfotransferase [Companilactobacillus sp. RD055328]|uniref:aryl-sulfate sulfotransferase n=1 Tax=Companilactobacillus sp. RD055328 TaxID=2916634 RepID=UPI001FC8B96B|nr:aryl-sulfate sulfotransferase [Companilactobacillus sp. RD055328]GKQ43183.1 aryl-sulfate sulfotransferase [Companilactobacillus sp. RD055328]
MKKRKKRIIAIIISVLAFFVIAVSAVWVNAKTVGVYTDKEIIENIDSNLITTRQKSQSNLVNEYKKLELSDDYTWENMYIKVNPFKTSPLSALAIFKTDTATKIKVEVVGKTDKTSIVNETDEYKTQHSISILGLYADYANKVKITATDKDGNETTKTIEVQTQALPEKLSKLKMTVTKNDKTKMDIGDSNLTMIIRSSKQPFGIDADGEIRWYSTDYAQHIFKQLSNGHILLMNKENNSEKVYNNLNETDYMGRIYKEYNFNGDTSTNETSSSDDETTIVHHDVIELPNKNLLLTVSDGSKYIEDTMVEVSYKTGKIVKVIDLKKILPTEMYKDYDSTTRSDGKIDWFHQNSIEYDTSDDSIIISSRHQDMIMKIDYKTNGIKWIYSGKTDWPSNYPKYLLVPKSGTTITGGQHAAIIVPGTNTDSDKDNVNIMLYNNNYSVTNGDDSTSGKYSEGVEYKINEADHTIEEVTSYGKDLGSEDFTDRIGSYRYLSSTNRLINFGYLNSQDGHASDIVETYNNEAVFKVRISNFGDKEWAYRAERYSLYTTDAEYEL